MPPRVNVTVRTSGEQKLARVGNAIKASGDKDLDRALRRSMQRSVKPLKAAARYGARRTLPVRGGLAERVAAAKFGARVTTSGSRVGVRITGASADNLRRMDEEGIVRHPVFGNRRNWVNEPIKPGWFSDAEEGKAPEVRDNIDRELDALAARLQAAG
jgi:hypothetical protein